MEFIHQALRNMQENLESMGSGMEVHYGYPHEVFRKLLERYQVASVFANEDYEPYARSRDLAIGEFLLEHGVAFRQFTDQVIMHPGRILKNDGKPYHVFTPYSRKWKAALTNADYREKDTGKKAGSFLQERSAGIPALSGIGFRETGIQFPPADWQPELIKDYDRTRNFPAIDGTSRLSVHLRFGTISIRKLVKVATGLNESFLNELIWREFYQAILWHYPSVVNKSFKPEYDNIKWRNNEQEFEAWCQGRTGYPFVDAGMRELNETGFMHNRLRMVTASFLVKHLLVDWRWGEAYFAEKLLDYELASNNGGWQWAAGSGCDAAPYFRIFNPILQANKFDPEKKYTSTWVPEWEDETYPEPLVEHSFARERCLKVFSAAVRNR